MERAISLATFAKIGIERELREALLKFAGIDITQPSMIRIAVTDRCNYKCAYCDHWRQESYKDELSAQAWSQVFENLRSLSASSILQFTGGEPFLRRDFIEIADYAKRAGFKWGVITNGYRLTDDVCGALCALSPLNVDISMDGAYAGIHDQARGVPGSFAAVTRGVKSLHDMRRRHKKTFKIRIKTTVHKLNIQTLADMVALTRDLGADSVDFSPIRVEDVANRKWLLPPDAQLNELSDIADELCRLKAAGAPIETTEAKLRSLPDHFSDKNVFHGAANCKAPLRDLSIDPSGEARFCWDYESLGNLSNASAEETWRSRAGKAVRHKALNCPKFGTSYCATSCLAHRKFSDNVKRTLQYVGF